MKHESMCQKYWMIYRNRDWYNLAEKQSPFRHWKNWPKRINNQVKPHKDEKLDKIVRGRIVPVEEKIAYIREIISRDNEVSFIKVIENVDKDEVIATFLSVLELIKSREIVVYQDLFFDDILIKKNLES